MKVDQAALQELYRHIAAYERRCEALAAQQDAEQAKRRGGK